MDDHDITNFIAGLEDAGAFTGPGTHEAVATPALLAHRRAGAVEAWTQTAITALRNGMRDDIPPPVARSLLQTPDAVLVDEAEPCCATEWFIDGLHRRAAQLSDVWVALAVPDTRSHRISVEDWNPANRGHGAHVDHMRWFVEVRGRGLGLQRGRLVHTGRTALRTDGPADPDVADDPRLLRLGRKVLHAHPIRRQ